MHRERICRDSRGRLERQPTVTQPQSPLTLNTPFYFTGVLRGSARGRRGGGKQEEVAQWWLSQLVIIAGQAHSTVSPVPSHLIPDTAVPSADIHQSPSLGPRPPCWRSALRWCLFFFKGQRRIPALQSVQASKLICVWAT